MPKVLSYTPAWLSRPSPGSGLFANNEASTQERNESHKGSTRPRRILAHRGAEAFVVVGNSIRWMDLCTLKYEWEEKQESPSGKVARTAAKEDEGMYKVLGVKVYGQIEQLIPSPNGQLLAILTSHTVYIAVLPDSSHLNFPDRGVLKTKTFQLGPTIHVLKQSPVVTALWHPLGIGGSCLVTITGEAVVRMWELKLDNKWSFDTPTLAVDIRKLQQGSSVEDDFSASAIGRNRGFSVDALAQDVVAASFGGTGTEGESGWCPMTLWLAMNEGDVYALCPLLPSKWQPSAVLLPSLTTTIVAQHTAAQANGVSAERKRISEAQYKWLAEIDRNEPEYLPAKDEFAEDVQVYSCPTTLGLIPRLQGPFNILPEEVGEELELTDIHVVAAKLDSDDLIGVVDRDEYENPESEGLSSTVVALLTRSGRVYVCLDLDGVEAQWLPTRKEALKMPKETIAQPELVLVEALDTLHHGSEAPNEWPLFTSDNHSRYSFFITNTRGVYHLSLDPWLENLEPELQSESTTGLNFRVGALTKAAQAKRERILQFPKIEDNHVAVVSNTIMVEDADLGLFLLTTYDGRPHAASLDSPQSNVLAVLPAHQFEYEEEINLGSMNVPRPTYDPPDAFYTDLSSQTRALAKLGPRYKVIAKEEIRLSSATFELMTRAHRILSEETYKLALAAADLFRRCERLQDEFRDQTQRTHEVAVKIEDVTGNDGPENNDESVNGRINRRIEQARTRQEKLAARHEMLKQKLARGGGRPLSEKEQGWIHEIQKIDAATLTPQSRAEGDGAHGRRELWQRYVDAQRLAKEMIELAKEAAEADKERAESRSSAFSVPAHVRKSKVSQVMDLLERETALVEAAQEKLERLGLAAEGE